jgi:hypothetical protein
VTTLAPVATWVALAAKALRGLADATRACDGPEAADAASAAAAELERALPGARVRALSEPVRAGRWMHDLLLELPDGGVFLVGYVERGGVPFPIRGAQRSRSADLLRVDGTALRIADAILWLDLARDLPLVRPLVAGLIRRQWSRRLGIEVDSAALAEASDGAIDRLRRAEARDRALRERVTADLRATDASGRDRASFRSARVSFLAARDGDAAAFERVKRPGDLLAAAEGLSRKGAIVEARWFVEASPGTLPPPLDRAVFAAVPPPANGSIVTARSEGLVHCAVVHELADAVDDGALRKERFFEEWLEARLAEAKVEWLRGL